MTDYLRDGAAIYRQSFATIRAESDLSAFAPDVVHHMIETLCGGEPATVSRVARRVEGMTGQLDAFQLRPGIEGLLKRLKARGLVLGAREPRWERLERAGIAGLPATPQPGRAARLLVGCAADPAREASGGGGRPQGTWGGDGGEDGEDGSFRPGRLCR